MPKIVVPPPRGGKGNKSTRGVYNNYINSHKALKPYAQLIWNAANEWGLDPVYFAALIVFESGGRPGAISSAGAIGLGQVMPGKTPPWMDHAVTAEELKNPALNLKIAAWYFSQGVRKYGTYQAAYFKYYNPGYKGGGPFANMPKGYVVQGGKSPADKADIAVSEAAAKAAQPVYSMAMAKQILDPIYISYTGKKAPLAAVKRYTTHPVSTYELTNRLSQFKSFFNSPVWKAAFPGYEAIWKEIYGPDSKPDRNAIRYAILHNLQGAFAQRLRDRPDYNKSQEYKGLYAQYSSGYSAIYGAPDENAKGKINMAIKKGWNSDQWKQFLRAQPEWQGSGEYKSLAMGLVNSLGFEPGLGSQQTVIGNA